MKTIDNYYSYNHFFTIDLRRYAINWAKRHLQATTDVSLEAMEDICYFCHWNTIEMECINP